MAVKGERGKGGMWGKEEDNHVSPVLGEDDNYVMAHWQED